MDKALVVYNPNSKNDYFKSNLYVLFQKISLNYVVEVYPTKFAKDIMGYLEDKVYQLIVVAGGDGTLNEIVNCNISNSKILYFPTGTTNDFGYTLNITKNFHQVLSLYENNEVMSVDSGLINNSIYFNYVVGLGPFTSSSFLTNQRMKDLLGTNAYFLTGLSKIKPKDRLKLEILVDNEQINGEFLFCLIVNSKSVAGIRNLFPLNQLDDGKFYLFLIKEDPGIHVVKAPLIMLNGVKREVDNSYLIVKEFSEIKIKNSQNKTWAVDGEEGPSGDIHIKVLNKYLNIYGK